MPSIRRYKDGSVAYKARIKHDYKEWFLGYFPTHEEALAEEKAMRLELTGIEHAYHRAPYE